MPSTYGILIKNGVNYSHDTAESISFDNTESGLTATNTQDAIDELTSMIPAGSGGHTIINDSGTSLAQKDNLQFKGVYTQNNGDNTEVDICRTMTKAQMEALSGESLKGFINTSDEPDSLPLTTDWVETDNGDSLTDRISDMENGIAEATTPTAEGISVTPNTTYTGTFVVRAYSLGRFFFITGYMLVSTQIPNNTQVATINLNGKTILQELYITSKASDTGDVVRMKITTDGKLQSESIIPSVNYYSFSCFGVLSV